MSTSAADPSERYVLPSDHPLPANLAALWATHPELARAIESSESQPSYSLFATRIDGAPTLSLPTDTGRQLQLHSRHNPIAEATQLVDTVNVSERGAFYVKGFGLGYHVRELFDRAGSDAFICVFEPDVVLLRTAFEAIDYSAMLASGRLWIASEPDKTAIFARLAPQAATVSMGFEPLVHQPSIALQPAFHAQVKTWIDEYLAYTRTTMATLVINGKRTAENIAINLPWYAATPSLSRLQNAYRGKPAIIVSAGPSLRKNKHLLKDAQGKAAIIAVQTSLQPLLEIGVEPQFVTSLDYHDICTRFFEKLPRDLKTELIAEPKASSAVFDLNPGPLSLLGNEFAESLLAEMNLNKTRLTSGATVAHLAFYLAEHLGCDPIIFVGQDLGFSDGLCYAPGTSYEDVWQPELSRFCTVEMKQWEQIVRDRNILRRTTDYQGRPTYTEERLFTYLQQFERDFANTKSRVIDATEGGVMKRGAQPMTLADAMATYCTDAFDLTPPAHHGLDWSRLPDVIDCLAQRRAEAETIARLSEQTLPLLEQIRDSIDDQAAVNRFIARIDPLRSQMHALATTYHLVMQLSQASELKKFLADRKINAGKLDGTSKQRRQVERDIDNVRSVLEAAGAFQKLMDDVIARVGAMPQFAGNTQLAREAA